MGDVVGAFAEVFAQFDASFSIDDHDAEACGTRVSGACAVGVGDELVAAVTVEVDERLREFDVGTFEGSRDDAHTTATMLGSVRSVRDDETIAAMRDDGSLARIIKQYDYQAP